MNMHLPENKVNPVIVDVREPAEFHDSHMKGAVNIPSTRFDLADYEAFRSQPIQLICATGIRAQRVKEKLEAAGFRHVHIHDVQMQAWIEQQSIGIEGSWTVDRQFRLTLGILLLISLSGQFFLSPMFAAIAVIICLGLTITAIIDRCYLKIAIARLPWNVKKVESGKYQ
jgi:rhodanese-related sulfurtransferase